MSSRSHVHVIDANVRRRAQIAYELMSRNLHAEIYEGLDEFAASMPRAGAVLIADCSPDCNPVALGLVLGEAGNPLPFAAYAEEPSPQGIVSAMLEGAIDYLRWPFERPLLEAALDRLADAGERRAKELRRQSVARAAVQELSERELEVLELMMLGDSNKEIGRKLQISPRTVEIHRGNMMRKLGARSPSDAVRVAMIAGIDSGDEERMAA